MTPGPTTLINRGPEFEPLVEVGDLDRAVLVSFGTLKFVLSNRGNPAVVTIRAEAYDAAGNRIPVASRGTTDIRNQVEYTLQEAPAQ